MTSSVQGAELFTEYTETDERELYKELCDLTKKRMDEICAKEPIAPRDTHSKSHAAVKAELTIHNIDEDAIRQQLVEKTPGISGRTGKIHAPDRRGVRPAPPEGGLELPSSTRFQLAPTISLLT